MNVWELHPALVHFPIALLLSAVAVDLFGWWRPNESLNRVATGLVIAGVGSGLLAANFGLLAFYTVPAHTHEAHWLMYWHIGFAVTSLVLFAWVAIVRWLRRTTGPSVASRLVGIFAAACLTITGYLGGAIVYHGGAGVDPELLIAEVREAHSHGRVAEEKHDNHGDRVARSYHSPDDESREEAQTGKDKHNSGDHDSNSDSRAASSQDHQGHDAKPSDKSHPEKHGTNERQKTKYHDSDDKHAGHKGEKDVADRGHDAEHSGRHGHDEDGDSKTAEDSADSKEREHTGRHTHNGHKSTKEGPETPSNGHAGHTKSKNVEANAKDHGDHEKPDSADSNGAPRRDDPPLGSDFEQNVLENRKRNLPKADSSGTMSDDHEAKP